LLLVLLDLLLEMLNHRTWRRRWPSLACALPFAAAQTTTAAAALLLSLGEHLDELLELLLSLLSALSISLLLVLLDLLLEVLNHRTGRRWRPILALALGPLRSLLLLLHHLHHPAGAHLETRLTGLTSTLVLKLGRRRRWKLHTRALTAAIATNSAEATTT
jgi:hypothetical protein